MKKSLIFLSIIFLFVQFQKLEAQQKRSSRTNGVRTAQEIAKLALQSTVLIVTEGESGQTIGRGSGFVFAPGLVVSNLHVFERATNAYVKLLRSGKVFKATEVVAISAKDDICVIRIGSTSIPVLQLGDSDKVDTGDEIFVASNPKGLEGSFTKGIVSSIRKQAGLLQIDAAISPGSSGGVLLNTKAEAVGIVRSSVVSGQNLNFAIPINKLKILSKRFNHPIVLAGSCAYSDADKEGLVGPVQRTETTDNTDTHSNDRARVVTIYDQIGNAKEIVNYDQNGSITWGVRNVYDDSGLMVSQMSLSKDSKDKVTKIKLSDAIKDKIENREFGIRVVRAVDDWEVFDDDGNRTESTLVGFSTRFKYDSLGRLAEEETRLGSELIFRSRYIFRVDSLGNWLEKTVFVTYSEGNERNSGRIIRKITYYE